MGGTHLYFQQEPETKTKSNEDSLEDDRIEIFLFISVSDKNRISLSTSACPLFNAFSFRKK
jgi:hypothetical protein